MEKNNLREEIIRISRELFEKQGYAATSVRKIAKEAGCTAGSLYYFFEGGKVEILQEVVQSYGINPMDSFGWLRETSSLDELVDRLVVELPKIFQTKIRNLNWLVVETSRLGDEEMDMLRKYPVSMLKNISEGVRLHVSAPKVCKQIAWLIYSTFYGYVELSDRISDSVEEPLPLDDIGEALKISIQSLVHEMEEKIIS